MPGIKREGPCHDPHAGDAVMTRGPIHLKNESELQLKMKSQLKESVK